MGRVFSGHLGIQVGLAVSRVPGKLRALEGVGQKRRKEAAVGESAREPNSPWRARKGEFEGW